jgi:hypothetical protein
MISFYAKGGLDRNIRDKPDTMSRIKGHPNPERSGKTDEHETYPMGLKTEKKRSA